jgi:hypothetical protein
MYNRINHGAGGWVIFTGGGAGLRPLYVYINCPKSSAYFQEMPWSVCIWEQVPWPVNFRRRFIPPLFGNFLKHLTLLPSEISEKSREEIKKFLLQDSA